MVGADMRKMAEYRAQLDREREMKLAQGSSNSYKRNLHSDTEDEDEESDDSSGHHHKKKKHKKEKKSKKEKKKHKVNALCYTRCSHSRSFIVYIFTEISQEKEEE
jgi:ABC-type Zn2+ transport system substrate-binding protein/surface adhesin